LKQNAIKKNNRKNCKRPEPKEKTGGMKHNLSINWIVDENPLGSPLWSLFTTVVAEINLPPCPQLSPRASIVGRIVAITSELYQAFTFSKGVEVRFDGRAYTFDRLEDDGRFELHKTW